MPGHELLNCCSPESVLQKDLWTWCTFCQTPSKTKTVHCKIPKPYTISPGLHFAIHVIVHTISINSIRNAIPNPSVSYNSRKKTMHAGVVLRSTRVQFPNFLMHMVKDPLRTLIVMIPVTVDIMVILVTHTLDGWGSPIIRVGQLRQPRTKLGMNISFVIYQ